MKILFINLPYYGHVIPTIGLVQELSSQIRNAYKVAECSGNQGGVKEILEFYHKEKK